MVETSRRQSKVELVLGLYLTVMATYAVFEWVIQPLAEWVRA